MAYSLGPVKPHVQATAERIGALFHPSSILGWGLRSRESDHPLGLALDLIVGNDSTKGSAIAAHVAANAAGYGVKYYIWQQHIYNFDAKGRPSGDHAMENRGSATENHMDHVHVSFYSTPGTGQISGSTGTATRTAKGCAKKVAPAVVLVAGSAIYSIVEIATRVLGG